MKKIFMLLAVIGIAFSLTGCDINKQEVKDVIQQCKADEECKAIFDKEIDDALAERGITGSDNGVFDDYYNYELTEEEQALYETTQALEEEVFNKLETMTEDEYNAIELKLVEFYLGRSLTPEEITALSLVEGLYESVEVNIEEEYQTDQEYLESTLGRALTQEELAAIETMTTLFETEDFDGESELTEEQNIAIDLVYSLFEEAYKVSEVNELTELLGRDLTAEEQNAFDVIYSIDEETEFTEEQNAAFDLIDKLYDDAYKASELDELKTLLGRDLTTEEQNAFDVIYAIDEETEFTEEQNAAFDLINKLYDDAYKASELDELKTLLGRDLTAEEQNAFDVIYSIDEETEFTEEQNAAFDLIDKLYEDAYKNFEKIELETMLGRSLTEEELLALEVVNNIYTEVYNFEESNFEQDNTKEMILYYELILGRTLTDDEKVAVEFSMNYMCCEEDAYFESENYDYFDEDYTE